MSINNFVKGACRHCSGQLEFPAEATGETITCPHCGQPTVLAAGELTPKKKSIWVIFALVIVMAGGLAGALLILRHPAIAPMAPPSALVPITNLPAPSVMAPIVPSNTPPVQAFSPDDNLTNEFAISPVKLEKTPGSSLVYVTGKVRNLSDRQRFGVKVEFRLFDTNDTAIGKATDYQPVLDPHGDWSFKAMIMESKAVSAKFGGILEDQ
jgi:hypothetical protein